MRGLRILLPFVVTLAPACVTTERTVQEQATPTRLLERAEEQAAARRYEEALRGFQMAAVASQGEALERPSERGVLVRALAGAARVHALEGRAGEARRWLEQAEGFVDRGDGEAMCSVLLARGLVEREEGRTNAARATFAELHARAREEDLAARAVQAAHLASVVSEGEEQLAWGRRALEAAEGQRAWQGPLWSNLGWMLDRLGRTEEALEAFQRARELELEQGTSHGRLVADWQFARALRRAGRLDEARMLLSTTLTRARERYVAGRTPLDAEWLGRCYLERAELERLDALSLAAAAGDPDRAEAARLRERAVADLGRARRLLLEAGADRLAPELLARVRSLVEELAPREPS